LSIDTVFLELSHTDYYLLFSTDYCSVISSILWGIFLWEGLDITVNVLIVYFKVTKVSFMEFCCFAVQNAALCRVTSNSEAAEESV